MQNMKHDMKEILILSWLCIYDKLYLMDILTGEAAGPGGPVSP